MFKVEIPEKRALSIPATPDPIDSDGEYLRLANKVGFEGVETALAVARTENMRIVFRQVLAENGICVYNRRKVHRYLRRICPRGFKAAWIPLKPSGRYPDGSIYATRYWIGSGWFGRNDLIPEELHGHSAIYEKPIPVEVLMIMERISQDFSQDFERRDQLRFFVSDFRKKGASPHMDPFLAVQYKQDFYIIERWDEPGFRQ